MSDKIVGLKDLIENRVEIDCPNDIITIHFDVQGLSALFQNRNFKCKKLIFEHISNPEYNFKFHDCTFDCEVSFRNCKLDSISFLNTKLLKSLILNSGNRNNLKSEINSFIFKNDIENDKKETSTYFIFNNVFFKKYFEFNNINNSKGLFSFSNNTIGDKEFKNVSSCVFHSSHLSNLRFSNNIFSTYTSFKKSIFSFNKDNFKNTGSHWNESEFERNEFHKVNFSEAEFVNYIKFDKCDFLSTTWFENCKNLENSELKFVSCEFKSFSLFNKSKINFLNIDRCTFDKSSSFTDAEFNILKLFEVKFGGGAYFDEMKINKVLDKSYLKDNSKILEWKRTLRAIKQESQKTENKIDFNNYRNYELAAHYKELRLRTNFKDTSILWATKWSSNFGNWFWAFWFTIISGFIWYSILYTIENSGEYNSDQIESYFISLFRFFLITDFYSPFEAGRNYLSNIGSWIPFIFGKIFIAFGLYEMIQSFRKFKA